MQDIESGEQVGEKILPAYPQSVVHSGETMLIGFDDGTVRQFSFADFGYDRIHDQNMTVELGM